MATPVQWRLSSLFRGAVSDILTRLQAALKDRYAIQRELGRGGMATVYLATDQKHERDVAIKVLHPELAVAVGPERFDREIKFVAKLQHPNILGLFDSGEADGFLSMARRPETASSEAASS